LNSEEFGSDQKIKRQIRSRPPSSAIALPTNAPRDTATEAGPLHYVQGCGRERRSALACICYTSIRTIAWTATKGVRISHKPTIRPNLVSSWAWMRHPRCSKGNGSYSSRGGRNSSADDIVYHKC